MSSMPPRSVGTPASPWSTRRLALAVALFVALAMALTWPQATHMASHTIDSDDALLSIWRMQWIAHQLPRHPLDLWDGNIFYPERRTLSYSDAVMLPTLAAAPLAWCGLNRVLSYNVVLLAGIVLSGVTMFFLVRDLTGATAAGVFAGVVFAFAPYRLDHIGHLELQHAWAMPLALWALERVLRTGKIIDGVWTGLGVAAQALCSLYYGIFFATYLVVVGPFLFAAAHRAARRHAIMGLLCGGVVAAALLLPYARPYLESRGEVGDRQIREISAYSATWADFLATPPTNALYGASTGTWGRAERRLFPGAAVVLVSLLALWPPWSWRRAGHGVGLLFAIEAARGYQGWLYPWLHAFVLPYHGLRVPARFGMLMLLSLAVLGGYGVARLVTFARRPAWRHTIGVAAVALLVVEYRSQPLPLVSVPAVPPAVYTWLAAQPPAVVLELPVPTADRLDFFYDGWYMYYSTFHWQRLVNGYSGFYPPSFLLMLDALRTFPDEASLAQLRKRDVSLLVLHAGNYAEPGQYADVVASVLGRTDLRFVGRFAEPGGGAVVFALTR